MRYLSSVSAVFIIVFAFITAPTTARPGSIWSVHIDKDPAPPPDEGPPQSAGALRDKSKLKYEIAGIVGAYGFWLILTFILFIFVGKRLRRKYQTSNRTLSMEIIKPAPLANNPTMMVEAPLKSPGKMASLKSWASSGRTHSRKQSNVTVSTIDERILEADKAKNMDEMTKLYAAVMLHDEARPQRAQSSAQTTPRSPCFPQNEGLPPTPRSAYNVPPTPRSPHYQASGNGPLSPRFPPEFQHLHKLQSDEASPPALIHPLAPTPAEDPASRTGSQNSRKSKISQLSLIPGRSDSADQNKRRPSRISVRGQPISQPLGSAALTDSSVYSEQGSVSPRIYHPGPPPPTPGQKTPVVSTEDVEKKGPPAPLSLRSAAASNSSHTLPFRQFYDGSLKSAPPTKTTFLDRRESALGVHPKTGVPQTPYSPYMPMTPMTPVTPSMLVTKKDRKRMKKEGMKVLSEDDMVMSDEDMWGELK
ncbi:hypothetical protein PV05_03453 [Exophiala xenobiotica]|uniref:Uncharacterized protein n=1 Tax=Exophiala xenobiotica TaxID=348802 RepID=A0A0D2ETD1_9EURO|nr:uncharacterized protein PV05_03453 [Exophiala xenobiotica]KIW58963.1 hypothetical protein PV05_03453 [Exophiala xenobiotica]